MVRRLEVVAVRRGRLEVRRDQVAVEAPVRLSPEGRAPVVLMATPGSEAALAAGYALTMGWATPADPPPAAIWDQSAGEVRLAPSGPVREPEAVRAAGGGLLGPLEAPPLAAGGGLELAVLAGLTGVMTRAQSLFPLTGGAHAAAVYDAGGGLLAMAEDVGRHNALDKAVGAAWLAGLLPLAAALALSGRCSLEMVLKAVRSGIGVAVSVSAPTAPAVEAARRLGLTLAGFARHGDLNLYSHPERIRNHGAPLPELA